jgi:hypothetical protein
LKKVFVLLLALLALVGVLYALAGRVSSKDGQRATAPANVGYIAARLSAPIHPATTATQTATPARCVIVTGLQDGRVNLRSCAGLACGVSSVLTEGEPLTLLRPGRWAQVRTGAGLTGYINSKFCK